MEGSATGEKEDAEGIEADTKRDPVYDENNVWVYTQPKEVMDFGGQESTILKWELTFLKHENAFLVCQKRERICG